MADEAALRRWPASATALNAVAGVGLFVQKSDDHSSIGTIGLLSLACAGVYLILPQLSHIDIAATNILTCWAQCLVARDWHPSQRLLVFFSSPPRSWVSTWLRPASCQLPNAPSTIEGYLPKDRTEEVINRTTDVQAVNRFAFVAKSEGRVACRDVIYVYELEKSVSVLSDGTLKGEARAETGPLEGFNITVGGSASMGCDASELRIELPTTIILDPESTATVAHDVPSTINATVLDVVGVSDNPEEDQKEGDKVKSSVCFPVPLTLHVEASVATSGEYEVVYSRAYGTLGQEAPEGALSPLPC